MISIYSFSIPDHQYELSCMQMLCLNNPSCNFFAHILPVSESAVKQRYNISL